MESINLQLDPDNDGEAFNERLAECVANGIPDYGDLTLTIKNKATVGGKPAVMVSFTVLRDDERVRVQTVTTLALLKNAIDGLWAASGDQV